MYTELSGIEIHPWQPFLPKGAKVLIMGTFPPGRHRWSMDFYYPNRTNDFWKMCGLIFMGSENALMRPDGKGFRIDDIKNILTQKHIALSDSAYKIRRLKNNASDKYLEIIEPVNLSALLARIPQCRALATTGAKAAGVVAELTSTAIPAMGKMELSSGGLEVWRMPSTSRAYPLPVQAKAAFYAEMFRHLGII